MIEQHTGFTDPAGQSQSVFRAVMAALAEPCKPVALSANFQPPPPLSATAAAIVLALADFETTLYLDPTLACQANVAGYFRFHAGAKLTVDPAAADFAVISRNATLPDLAAFAHGQLDYPDRSTTVIVETAQFNRRDWLCQGPGISGHRQFGFAGAPADFAALWDLNHGRYPMGVDMLFASSSHVVGLPRSAKLTKV